MNRVADHAVTIMLTPIILAGILAGVIFHGFRIGLTLSAEVINWWRQQ